MFNIDAAGRSRWKRIPGSCGATLTTDLDVETRTTLAGALTSTNDANTVLRDIDIAEGTENCNDDRAIGARIEAGEIHTIEPRDTPLEPRDTPLEP